MATTRPKIFEMLYSLQETIAQWKVPCSNRIFGYWMDKFNKRINDPLSQRKIVLVIVCIVLLLDNMLYMVIVPIIPTYLRQIHAFSKEKQVTTSVNTTFDLMTSTTFQPPTNSIVSSEPTTAGTVKPSEKPSEPNNTIVRSIKMLGTVYIPSENEDVNIGVLFACKAIFQLLVNPFTGTLMDRIGYDIPMMIGLTIIFFSTNMFAFGKSYGALFVARSMQGIGSAFADTSGLAMIADRYTEDSERSAALGIALAFISFGSLVAPPFGGALYEFAGKALPFLLLSLLALGDGCLMLFAMKPVRKKRREWKKEDKLLRGTPIYKLIIDPYIAVCAGCLVMANVSLAFIEPTIALWMKDTMNSPEWQMGLIWLPAFPPHVLGVFITVKLAKRYPNKQWLMAAIGLAMEGISCMVIPFCNSFALLMIPLSTLCFGIALVDTAILPVMGHLVDIRHVAVYGSIYAIADISYSMAYSFGPILAGQIVKTIGFTALNAGIFVSNIVYAPLLVILRTAYDYQPLKPEEDSQGEGGTPNHLLYQSFTANSEENDLKLDLNEQTMTYSNGKIPKASSSDAISTDEMAALHLTKHSNSAEGDSPFTSINSNLSDNDYGTTADVKTYKTTVPDDASVQELPDYGYDDKVEIKKAIPTPARRMSIEKRPVTEQTDTDDLETSSDEESYGE